jgi:hypothetical protein
MLLSYPKRYVIKYVTAGFKIKSLQTEIRKSKTLQDKNFFYPKEAHSSTKKLSAKLDFFQDNLFDGGTYQKQMPTRNSIS